MLSGVYEHTGRHAESVTTVEERPNERVILQLELAGSYWQVL